MRKNHVLFLTSAAMLVFLVTGCGPEVSSSSDSSSTSSGSSDSSSDSSSESSSSSSIDMGDGETLKMSVKYQNDTMMKLDASASPYAAADGTTYLTGDFKPVWKELQSRLSFTIDDVTPIANNSVKDTFEKDWLPANFAGVDILNGPSEDFVTYGTTTDSFVNLAAHLDEMPNFKAFLEANPIVKLNILAGDGGIYYAPYFDGYNDLERMFITRNDWVEKLLDVESPTFDTVTTIDTKHYQPYLAEAVTQDITVPADVTGSTTKVIHKAFTANVITTQNAEATLNGANSCAILRSHIDSTYGSQYAKRSDLFNGVDAAYDADELVALFRCVKTNPNYLTGQSAKPLVPFYPRGSTFDRQSDLYRLAMIWGVRGVESRNGYLYVDDDGVLQDARNSADMIDALHRMNDLYDEGLILADFDLKSATSGAKGDFRTDLNNANLGFMTYDYNQTTTVFNSLGDGATPTISGYNLAPVLPAVADWHKDGNLFHFSESIRSVKTEGWGITSTTTGRKLTKAIQLFDYLYGVEGNTLMSYGPSQWIDGTIMYNGQSAPRLSAAALNELATLPKALGNYTNYYRRYLGGTFPVGYIKQQAMEYQTVHARGQAGLDKILHAMSIGTMKVVLPLVPETTSPFYTLTPTTYSFTATESTLMKDLLATLGSKFNPTSGTSGYVEWTTLIKNDFVDADYTANLTTWKLDTYIYMYRTAYARMVAAAAAIEL